MTVTILPSFEAFDCEHRRNSSQKSGQDKRKENKGDKSEGEKMLRKNGQETRETLKRER